MIQRHHVESNFFEEAEQLRGVLDASFDKPYEDSFSWHYYSVPQLYTYLRAYPKNVFPAAMFQRFRERLRSWTFDNLGLVPMGDPTLHMMLNGHNLSLHSDFHNGAWGYVYSLTRWDQRKFSGGETLLLKDGVPSYKRHHAHGSTVYDLIPAQFNQLLVFDDRIIHATPAIEGGLSPKEGRIAMVGHIRATGPKVSGPLDAAAARNVVREVLPRLAEQMRLFKDVQGTMSYRLRVTPDGAVDSLDVLTNNLVVAATGYGPSEAVTGAKSKIQALLKALRFPAAPGPSHVTVPVLVPVPDLRPLEIKVPHALSTDAARMCVKRVLPTIAEGSIQSVETASAAMDPLEFVVTEPIQGVIRVRTDEITASFEAPMWVPSQRAQFEVDVTEGLKRGVAADACA